MSRHRKYGSASHSPGDSILYHKWFIVLVIIPSFFLAGYMLWNHEEFADYSDELTEAQNSFPQYGKPTRVERRRPYYPRYGTSYMEVWTDKGYHYKYRSGITEATLISVDRD